MAEQRIQLPQTTPEQRSQFYKDVENMLNPGFLSLSLALGEVQVSLRSPSPGDLFLIRQRSDMGSDLDWAQWSLATCTWMVDGYVVDDVNMAPYLRTLYQGLPDFGFSKLFSAFLSLFTRARDAVKDVYPFCLEGVSRMRWRQVSHSQLNSQSVTGVPGTSQLGLNAVQRVWIAYNTIEDMREQDDRSWQRAKFIASTQAPKYVQQVNNREKTNQETLEGVNQETLDLFFYQKIGVLDEDAKLSDGSNIARLKSPKKSTEDLNDEYWRWVNNDLDEHDILVENYKKHLREEYERSKEAQKQQWAELDEILTLQEEEMESADSAYLTPEELEEKLKGRSRIRKVYDDKRVKAQAHVMSSHLEATEVAPPDSLVFDAESGKWIEPRKPLSEALRDRRPTLHTTDS